MSDGRAIGPEVGVLSPVFLGWPFLVFEAVDAFLALPGLMPDVDARLPFLAPPVAAAVVDLAGRPSPAGRGGAMSWARTGWPRLDGVLAVE